jgi:hypothetical protein
MVVGLVAFLSKWLSNWFAKWISLECSPRIVKLHSLHSFSLSNWQLIHSFPFSQASWLLNHLKKALYLFGRLASGFANVRRSHPTNVALRIRIRVRFESAFVISWFLCLFFFSKPSSRASIITNYFYQISVAVIQSPERCREIKSNGTKLRQHQQLNVFSDEGEKARIMRNEGEETSNQIMYTSARTRTNHSNRYRGCNLFDRRKLLRRPKALHQTHTNEESHIVRPDSVWHPFHNIWQ